MKGTIEKLASMQTVEVGEGSDTIRFHLADDIYIDVRMEGNHLNVRNGGQSVVRSLKIVPRVSNSICIGVEDSE